MEQNNKRPHGGVNNNIPGAQKPQRAGTSRVNGSVPRTPANTGANGTQPKSVRPNTGARPAQPQTQKAGQVAQNGTVYRTSKPINSGKSAAPQKGEIRLSQADRERLIREEQNRIKKKRRAFWEYIGSIALMFVIFLLVAVLLVSSVFFINLFAHKDPDARSYSLVLSDYENELVIENGSVVGDDGIRYVNFSQIAEFYGFAMVGSIDNMKYVVKESENETVSFKPGSDKVLVNDVALRSGGHAFYENGDLFVDQKFVSEYIKGFELLTDTQKRTVSLSRILTNTLDAQGKIADGSDPEYESIAFSLKAPVVTASISETDSAVVMPTFEFLSNLKAYEDYMNPGSTTEFLTLVSVTSKLSEDYIPTGLSLLSYGDGMYLKEYAAKSFEAMMKEAAACGISGITVNKAYVSYEEALTAYNAVVDKYVNLLGNDQANRYAAATLPPPGTDEHQTGLSVDLGLQVGAYFSSSTAFAWLCDNSYKFGFILRYPPNKTDVTGHVYKPEQFRYVGRYHAVRMNALGLTLDEYAEYLGL
ncbi:MAG: M15 family metallopeptidase [Clostridia bacterium]|nr:M15 family metallopeptidase [Clostridia bacterium]